MFCRHWASQYFSISCSLFCLYLRTADGIYWRKWTDPLFGFQGRCPQVACSVPPLAELTWRPEELKVPDLKDNQIFFFLINRRLAVKKFHSPSDVTESDLDCSSFIFASRSVCRSTWRHLWQLVISQIEQDKAPAPRPSEASVRDSLCFPLHPYSSNRVCGTTNMMTWYRIHLNKKTLCHLWAPPDNWNIVFLLGSVAAADLERERNNQTNIFYFPLISRNLLASIELTLDLSLIVFLLLCLFLQLFPELWRQWG